MRFINDLNNNNNNNPADQCLDSEVQFSPFSQDFPSRGRYRYNRPESRSKSAKKRKIKAITAFKVIQGHRGRYLSKARMRLSITD